MTFIIISEIRHNPHSSKPLDKIQPRLRLKERSFVGGPLILILVSVAFGEQKRLQVKGSAKIQRYRSSLLAYRIHSLVE
jgi:hypothetical protein